jgi:LysM repeat protein
VPGDRFSKANRDPSTGALVASTMAAAVTYQMHTIPVTLAERPHPFPSRTRKLSSPAPKILRGQPFGKIGRRRGCCFNGLSGGGSSELRGILLQMSDPGDAPHTGPEAASRAASRSARRRDADAVTAVCPLLVSDDASWRSAYASRDHRCWAVRPPAPLILKKQRELCLTAGHASCTTYVAANGDPEGDRDLVSVGTGHTSSLLWPPVRSIPLTLEPSRGRTTALPSAPGRAGGQALLVGLMVLAFLVLVIARTSTPSQAPSSSLGAGDASAAIAPSPSAVATPSATPAATQGATQGASPAPATPSPGPSLTPVPSLTPDPSATPTASTVRTYKVQSGDTLGAIAARFGVTVKAIAKANGIADPRLIRVGQVLVIP